MYRITYIWDENTLGQSVSFHDDIFKALKEGEEMAKVIAKSLATKIKGVKPDHIEIQVRSYDPQLNFEGMPKKKVDTMTRTPGQQTLKTMRN